MRINIITKSSNVELNTLDIAAVVGAAFLVAATMAILAWPAIHRVVC